MQTSPSPRNGAFSYKNRLNPRSYATCGGKTRSKTEAAESFRTDRVDLIGETELVRKFTRELAMFTRQDRNKPIDETELIREITKDTEIWQSSLGGTEMNQSVRPSWSGKLPKIPVRVRLGF